MLATRGSACTTMAAMLAASALPADDGPADLVIVTFRGTGRPASVSHTLAGLADRLAKEEGCAREDIEIVLRVKTLAGGAREETYRVRRKQ